MPEANVLYSVTAAVVLGLATWVAVVLKTAKEPWARDLPKPARAADDVPLEPSAETEAAPEPSAPPSSSLPKVVAGTTTTGADTTAEATAVVLAPKGEPDAKVDAEASPKADLKE